MIYYKIFTHGGIVDINAFAPRDYMKMKKDLKKDEIAKLAGCSSEGFEEAIELASAKADKVEDVNLVKAIVVLGWICTVFLILFYSIASCAIVVQG